MLGLGPESRGDNAGNRHPMKSISVSHISTDSPTVQSQAWPRFGACPDQQELQNAKGCLMCLSPAGTLHLQGGTGPRCLHSCFPRHFTKAGRMLEELWS